MMNIDFFVRERSGIARKKEPVTAGVPIPKGQVFDENSLVLMGAGLPVPLQTKVLERWSDGSIKWVLIDSQADCSANSIEQYVLSSMPADHSSGLIQGISIHKTDKSIVVNTGTAEFSLDRKEFRPFSGIKVGDHEHLNNKDAQLVLIDAEGSTLQPVVDSMEIETNGPLRSVVRTCGRFLTGQQKPFCEYEARSHFYSGTSNLKFEFTLRNSRRAHHQGGLWDLGDRGSIHIRQFSFQLPLLSQNTPTIRWRTQPNNALHELRSGAFMIYQDSSGGANWKSKNHLNRTGEIPLKFKGYKVSSDDSVLEEGERADPILSILDGDRKVAASIVDFWQNFPIALEAQDRTLRLKFYPSEATDVMELQGGEQKTYRFGIGFGSDAEDQVSSAQNPLIVSLAPELYARSGAFGHLTLHGHERHSKYREFIDAGLTGPRNFFTKREVVDEYGWRHFGCVWGDHESVREIGPEPLMSHYNNQYDLVNGFLLQGVRSQDERWFELMRDQAFHMIDIDIYHTQKDKAAYNGGLFWHTEHYLPASTSTHRTYSIHALNGRKPENCGGGPSCEHNYTTGLMNFYFLTGHEPAKEAVVGLADWVIGMDDGNKTIFRFIDRNDTGMASRTVSSDYYGPGRGAGNSINALLDAYVLTRDWKYLEKVEQLIRRSVHPESDIRTNKLDQPEYRWSYLVFLQVLGKYLDLKQEWGEEDKMFQYARLSLIHYADWMVVNERPYAQMKEKVLIWTESWPVHDIRKSYVFDYAAKYTYGPDRSKFMEKSEFFYETALKDLGQFETRDFTRPLAVLMHYGCMHDEFVRSHEPYTGRLDQKMDFGKPERFVPQQERVKKKAVILGVIALGLLFVLLATLFMLH